MRNSKTIQHKSVRKTIVVVLMCFCLLFLTGINFVLYPSAAADITVVTDAETGETNDNLPTNPVEEKPVTGPNIAEEFLHEHFYLDVSVINKLLLHKIHEAENLQIVHYELLSPPPEFNS